MAEKNLVIVESPAKARTIEKYLGQDFTVLSTMGHVRDLPKHRFGVNIQEGFTPTYEPLPERKEALKRLQTATKKAKEIYLATDPDREGEAIAWHVKEALKLKQIQRIEFNEITKEAVRRALEHPREIDMQRVEAQQARRILDRIVGYMLSPLISKKIRSRLSAGRVQSVAVRLICEREREIQNFVPEEYWSITATLTPQGESRPFDAKLYKRTNGEEKLKISNGEQAQQILKELEGATYRVLKVEEKEQRRHAPLPFTTSTLQQEASKKLGFSTKKTMSIAQQLYEGVELGAEGATGLITYMRTDSTRISEEAQTMARAFIASKYGKEYVHTGEVRRAKKSNIQDAHEAIRPTVVTRLPEEVADYLTPDQLKLYRLIWQRFVASQMASAVFDVVSVEIQGGEYLFRASGSVLKFPGWLAVYEEARDEDRPSDDEETTGQLPPLREQQLLDLVQLTPKQHFTEPPPRYTEATLVKALEENGIGRPSTYAPTISTILERGYVKLEKRRFVPTELGFLVTDALVKHFPKVVDVGFTALIEEELDKIEEGQLDRITVLQDFYREFASAYEKAKAEMESLKPPPIETDESCPECGKRLVIRTGRYGRFYSCSGFPKCRYTRPLETETKADEMPQANETKSCPKCSAPMALRRGRYGPFYGCTRYPDCDGIVNLERAREESPVRCPKCNGALVKRYARKGGRSFWGCENYPNCDFTVNQTPVKPCPVCKEGVLVEGAEGELICSNKQCEHRESVTPVAV
ncbi:MAG: type I DNA topoisomerase [Candidatus Bipolaricaulota bacterium]|nr:type I DNA topoisomerase [Candidatus Bipolaricaulota bacterium]MCS7274610.1 type I DNA topoisomerase [Candidatus Bipolaricaulota bacterium]MDW8110959.1 type I DNA topoisomerase [Candidatus Bipolaricaulota bacterium]MDW8329040.1 type I DNA topoisomerase [Candidatus Bipolaricaulota bacterium]